MRLSVIVTLVDGGETLARCLAALMAQQDPPELEVIVPWDESVAGGATLAARFPACRFVPLGPLPTTEPQDSPAGQHEVFDRRRSGGLAVARGQVVALLEDRSRPRPDWARTMVTLHEQLPHAVIGGAIENANDHVLQRAVYYCDYARYQLPFAAGPRAYVSDVNVGYKQRAIEATASLWRERYHETTVHWALQRSGETLYLSPQLVVDHVRASRTLGALLRERFAWGRLFAYTRARELSRSRSAALGVLAPVLPVLLFARQVKLQAARGRLGEFLPAAPASLLLLATWSVGEAAGYLTGKA